MSVNRYQPHVYVLPEDAANREIANGFQLHGSLNSHSIQVMPTLRGWPDVRDKFADEYVRILRNNTNTHVVLLIDFDENLDRPNAMNIPAELRNRVFVIGVWSTPEDLRRTMLASFEQIGWKLADACRTDSTIEWDHELLRHNADELDRMRSVLRPILFRH
jgi:hypothetical protein